MPGTFRALGHGGEHGMAGLGPGQLLCPGEGRGRGHKGIGPAFISRSEFGAEGLWNEILKSGLM